MTATRSPRWLMSFADLCLLLLGFFVLLHARTDGHATAASVRAAFGGGQGRSIVQQWGADQLFEPGEAMLRPFAARRLAALGHQIAAGHRRLRIDSRGGEAGNGRLDAWELAAARAAAVARAVASGGLSAQRIDIALPPGREAMAGPQRLTVGAA